MSAFRSDGGAIMDHIHQIDTNQDKLTICSEQFSNIKLQDLDELPGFWGFEESEVYSKNIFEGISISEDDQGTVSSLEYRVLGNDEERPSEEKIKESQKVVFTNVSRKSKSKSGPRRETKSKNIHWLVGTCTDVLRDDFVSAFKNDNKFELSGCFPFTGPRRLPTKMETLKLCLFMRDEAGKKNSKVSTSEIIRNVSQVIKNYWKMAGFDTKVRIEKDISHVIENYQKLLKDKSRTSEKVLQSRENFKNDCAKMLEVAHPLLEHKLSIDRIRGHLNLKTEDLEFLEDQRGARVGWMDKIDEEFGNRVKNCLKRKSASSSSTATSQFQTVQFQDDHDYDEEDNKEDDEDYNGNANIKRSKTITVEIPRKILTPSLTQTLDRTKTSDVSAMRVLSSTLKTFKTTDGKPLDLNEVYISRAAINKSRNIHREEISNEAKEQFKQNKPLNAALHWDGKLMKDYVNIEHETLAILVSGSPDYREGKIIGIVHLTDESGKPTSTGFAQADAVYKQLVEWDLIKEIKCLVFDTTASNSGYLQGAAIRLQNLLKVPIFYLACRHHVGELLVKNPWYAVMKVDLGPENAMFRKFNEIWSDIDKEAQIKLLDVDEDLKKELICFYTDILVKESKTKELFVRRDYKEMTELGLMLLGGKLPDEKSFSFRKCGARHKARFMAFGIYCQKMFAFCEQEVVRRNCFSTKVTTDTGKTTKKGKPITENKLVFDETILKNLEDLCIYMVTCYIPHFLSASIGCDAPINDLKLYRRLIQFKRINETIANEALKTFDRHKWYLVSYIAVFSLFSDKVDDDEKSRIAAKFISLPKHDQYQFGLPKFPLVDENTKLLDLITSESWQFFDILNLPGDWLALPPAEWKENPDYLAAAEFVKTVKVTNDVAERGVKIASDYANILTRDSNIRQKIFQVVEKDRLDNPDFTKKALN